MNKGRLFTQRINLQQACPLAEAHLHKIEHSPRFQISTPQASPPFPLNKPALERSVGARRPPGFPSGLCAGA